MPFINYWGTPASEEMFVSYRIIKSSCFRRPIYKISVCKTFSWTQIQNYVLRKNSNQTNSCYTHKLGTLKNLKFRDQELN